jgi:hypothetical protein
MAIEGSDYCSLPAHQAEDRKSSPNPDVVLLWFNLNDRWAQKFQDFLATKEHTRRQVREIAKRHATQAEAIGRNPHAVRKGVVDSGSPVFGPDGIKGRRVWAGNTIDTLGTAGYFLANAKVVQNGLAHGPCNHGSPRPDYRLLLELRIAGDGFEGTAREFLGDLFPEFADCTFGQVRVWANPPNVRDEIVHTLNFGARQTGLLPDCAIAFDGANDWNLAEIPPTVAEPAVLA